MTLRLVRGWFNRLPPTERDLPILILNGIAYTPRMILEEVERGTVLGERLQSMIEAGRLGTTAQEEFILAKLRLAQVLRKYPNVPIIASLSIPPKAYTPSELIEEIEKGSPVGMQFIQAELQHMRTILSLARTL